MAQTYDFKKVNVVVDGRFIVGFMDGSPVSTEKNADNVVPHIGADGEVTFTENNDKTGTINITLKQNSSSLAYLQKLSKEKREFAAQIVDANDGNFRAGGSQCRILKTPGREFGSEVSGVEVQIYVADYDAK